MYYRIILLLCFLTSTTFAQTKITDLTGSWIAGKISYLSDEELPDENLLKYTYVKYTFSLPDKINVSGIYYDRGPEHLFELQGNRLLIKSSAGYVINTLRILESTKDKLVLVSASSDGDLESPTALKYTYYPEPLIQKGTPLNPNDIFRVNGTDTIFRSGQKIYAPFQGPVYQEYISTELQKKGIKGEGGELLATFIVNASGQADSLRIIQGINPKYDKAYTKIFSAAKNKWKPAIHNGKPVSVLMDQRMKYLTFDGVMPDILNTQKASTAYNNKDYELALYYFDRALESRPEENDNLYRRGICKQMLGNMDGACSDWKKVKSLGSTIADALLIKHCH